jgi:hypothetical protein
LENFFFREILNDRPKNSWSYHLFYKGNFMWVVNLVAWWLHSLPSSLLFLSLYLYFFIIFLFYVYQANVYIYLFVLLFHFSQLRSSILVITFSHLSSLFIPLLTMLLSQAIYLSLILSSPFQCRAWYANGCSLQHCLKGTR